jgi:hypothetical protein
LKQNRYHSFQILVLNKHLPSCSCCWKWLGNLGCHSAQLSSREETYSHESSPVIQAVYN